MEIMKLPFSSMMKVIEERVLQYGIAIEVCTVVRKCHMLYNVQSKTLIAFIYDLKEFNDDVNEAHNCIFQLAHDTNQGEEPPYYMFFHSRGTWEALHMKYENYTLPHDSQFYIDAMAEFTEDWYTNCLWQLSFDELVDKICNCNDGYILCSFIAKLKESLHLTINDYLKTRWGKEFDALIDKMDVNSVEISKTKIRFKRKEEFSIFKTLLGTSATTTLYKYCGVDTLMHMLKDGTLAMSSIVCMNDNSESFYASDYLSHNGENHELDYWINHNAYITSFTTVAPKELLMWRLYGENSKGIAIEFDNTGDVNDNFMLAPVSYACKDGKHIELDFVGKLLTTKIEGHQLQLEYLPIWQRFFKHHDYAMEKEVRLLYIGETEFVKDEWVNANGIISPIWKISIKNSDYQYPLKMNRIHLGPNFCEPKVNKELVVIGLRRRGIRADVACSEINHYRVSK